MLGSHGQPIFIVYEEGDLQFGYIGQAYALQIDYCCYLIHIIRIDYLVLLEKTGKDYKQFG